MVEEFFVHDFAVLDRIERSFVHVESLAGHGTRFRGDIQFEAHYKAIAMRPGTFDLHAVDFMILFPPFPLGANGGDAFGSRRLPRRSTRFNAYDVVAVVR